MSKRTSNWRWFLPILVSLIGIGFRIFYYLCPRPPVTPGFVMPKEGDLVQHMCSTKGVLATPLAGGQILRFCVREKSGPDSYGRYHPQDYNTSLSTRGLEWTAVIPVGPARAEAVNPNQTYVIYALAADQQSSDDFDRYLARAKQNGDWNGLEKLPSGATILFQTQVRRQR